MNVKQYFAQLPKRVKIGSHWFKLRVSKEALILEDKQCAAWFHPRSVEIAIDYNYAIVRPASFLAETFLHELVHAAFWLYNVDEKNADEEEIVTLVTKALYSIYTDNPWLLPWLQKGLK